MGFITLLVLCCAFTAEAKDYENGSDVYRYGDTEFYSNIEDEDKLYKINLVDMSEEKLLEDHIISIIGKEDRLYLLAYNNGKSNLMCYNTSNGEYKLLEAFDNLITNISMQNDIFYFIQDKNIMSYDGDSITYVIGNGDVDLMFFTENNILKYYSQSQIGEYVEHTYTFNLSTTDTNITQNANTVELMSTSSYSPRLTEPSTDNAYYTSWNVFHTSGYGMLDYSGNKRGNCTCYAYGRSYENLGTKPNLSTSNAENWYNYNRNNGYYLYGSTPELGAVVVWSKGVIGNSDDGAGHVAVVEVISGDTVTTSESGWKSFYFKTVTRSASHSNFSAASSYTLQGFIYVMGSNPITPDTEAPVVSRAYTSNVSGNSFTINCDVYDNVAVTRAYIIVWGPGGNSGNGFNIDVFNNFNYTINTSDYGGAGTYTVHVYIFDAAGNSASAAINDIQAVSDTENPVISRLYTSNVNGDSFTINCDVYDNVAVTRAYIIVWGPGGNSGNGFSIDVFNNFSYTIKTSDYGGKGLYSVHVYVYDAQGNGTSAAVNDIQAVSDSETPVICDLRVSNVSSSSFTINCDVYDNVAVTRAYIIVWGPGGNSGNGFSIDVFNNFSYTINTSDYGGRGLYSVHVYVFDKEGNESHGAGLSNIEAVSDSEAPVMCSFYPSNISSKQFTINCDVYDNVAVTRAYIIVWGPGGNSGNGFSIDVFNNFNYTINTSDYGGAGKYSVHVYLFDADGNQTGAALNNLTIGDDSIAPEITNLEVTNVSDKSFTINCTANETIVRGWVNIYGPSKSDGYAVSMYGTSFMHTINTEPYGGAGDYEVHVYIWDVNGNEGAGKSTGKFKAAKIYTIKYDANGGTDSPAAQTKYQDQTLVLTDSMLTRQGYVFKGWSEDKTATSATWVAGSNFNENRNTTLYA